MNYSRKPFPFACKGMNLSLPSDRLPPDKYRVLFNTRPYGEGQAQGRQGTVSVMANIPPPVEGAVHSIKRMNDPIPSPSQFPGSFHESMRLLGVDESLTTAVADGGDTPTFYAELEAGFSGDPLGMCVARSDYNPRPFCIIGDSGKMRKVLSSQQIWQLGIAPPNFTPINITLFGAPGSAPDGPTVAPGGVPYLYRFRARAAADINTGAVSYPGVSVRDIDGVTPDGQLVTMQVPGFGHPDPQVAWLDVYRYGGTLLEWIYIGTVTNVGGFTFVDQFSDEAIANNERLDFDTYQPFVTLDTPKSGTCNVALLGGGGATITWVSGDQFAAYDALADQPYWPAGTQVAINGTAYTMYRSPDSETDFELLETPNTGAGGPFDFFIPSPELIHQPLSRIWGPFGGGASGTFFFAVGDPLRPGALYWTVGNRAEAHTPANVLDITSPTEPLMNGVMLDGSSYIFSTERMFRVYPNFGQVTDFIALEIPNAKGLLAPWAIAVGPKLWFLARDGIFEYEASGGEPRSITDDLYPIFPHEGVVLTENTYTIDGMEGVGFSPPDFERPNDLRLNYADGFLYFDYVDTGEVPLRRTLVYDTALRSWVSRDTYAQAVVTHYREEGENSNTVLMGTDIGTLLEYGGTADVDVAIDGQIRSGARDMDDPRPRKFWGDIQVDFDPNCDAITFKGGFDNFTFFSDLQETGADSSGRRRVVFDINGGLGQYAFNIGLDITWSATLGRPIFYLWEPSWVPKPELTVKRVTDWHDAEYAGAKFVQGFILKADTLGQDRTLAIQSDEGTVQQTFTINHNGEVEKPYSFTAPFITHLLREHPTDQEFWRMFQIRYIWEPAPELTFNWITQETTHDFRGFWHHRDGYIALISSDTVTLTITVDGTAFHYSIASQGGYGKPYLVFQPMKGKYATYSLVSEAGFRLFQRDTAIAVKPWGDSGPYLQKMPFGDVSRISGARI